MNVWFCKDVWLCKVHGISFAGLVCFLQLSCHFREEEEEEEEEEEGGGGGGGAEVVVVYQGEYSPVVSTQPHAMQRNLVY